MYNLTALSFRALLEADTGRYRALRLFALETEPAFFRTTYAEEAAVPLDHIRQRLLHTPHQRIIGAFDGEELVGLTGFKREPIALVHDHAFIWGVYVSPAARRRGAAAGMMAAVLNHAATIPELHRLTLRVHPHNRAARALYRRLGFTSASPVLNRYDEEEMLLPLK